MNVADIFGVVMCDTFGSNFYFVGGCGECAIVSLHIQLCDRCSPFSILCINWELKYTYCLGVAMHSQSI